MNPDTPPHLDPKEAGPRQESDTSRAHTDPVKSKEAFHDLARSIRRAMESGSRDARKVIDEGLPKAKEDFARGIHEIAYALSYATAFGGTIIADLTPDPLKKGFRDGASSGRKAAEDVLRQRRENSSGSTTESSSPEEPIPAS